MRKSLRTKHNAYFKLNTSLRSRLAEKNDYEEYLEKLEITENDDEKLKLEKEFELRRVKIKMAEDIIQRKKFLAYCKYIQDHPESGLQDPT